MKIAIKLPESIADKISSFPFLFSLNEMLKKRFQEDESNHYQLHLIDVESSIDILNLLPFTAFYHSLELSDTKNVFSIHRAVAAMNISDIDVFITLTESFVDASIGKNLKAKRNIGFLVKKNTLLLNEKVPFIENKSKAFNYHEMLKYIFTEAQNIPDLPNIKSRKLDLDLKAQAADYFMLDPDLDKEAINSEWSELFDYFQGIHCLLTVSTEDKDKAYGPVNDFIRNLSTKNTYSYLEYVSNIDMAKALCSSICLVTVNKNLALLNAFVGGKTFLVSDAKIDMEEVSFLPGSIESVVKGEKFDYSLIFDPLFHYVDQTIKSKDASESL